MSSFKSNKRIEQKVSRSIPIGPIGLAGGNLCPRGSPQTLCTVGREGWTSVNRAPSRVAAEGAETRSLRSACRSQCGLTPVPFEPKIVQDEQQYIQAHWRPGTSLGCHFSRGQCQDLDRSAEQVTVRESLCFPMTARGKDRCTDQKPTADPKPLTRGDDVPLCANLGGHLLQSVCCANVAE